MVCGAPIRERTVKELEHGVNFGNNTIENLQAAVGLPKNEGNEEVIGNLIESVNKTVWELKKELARRGGE